MALVGTHHINHRIPKNSELASLKLNASILFDEDHFTHQKAFGTDTWELHVGLTLSEMIDQVNLASEASENKSNRSIKISNLSVQAFKKGVMQWSTHRIEIEFDYEVTVNDETIKSDTISDFATGSGKEFGFLTFIPIIGNMNFDKGIEVAVSKALENCLFKLKNRWEK
jgi:hypothetical protein